MYLKEGHWRYLLYLQTNIFRHIEEVIRRSRYREPAIHPWTPGSRTDQEEEKTRKNASPMRAFKTEIASINKRTE